MIVGILVGLAASLVGIPLGMWWIRRRSGRREAAFTRRRRDTITALKIVEAVRTRLPAAKLTEADMRDFEFVRDVLGLKFTDLLRYAQDGRLPDEEESDP